MSNESAYLAQIRADTQYLKALLGRIAASSGITGSATPTVDFAVDMFDRADSDDLGGYWADTTGSWAIRSGICIPRGALRPAIAVPPALTAIGIQTLAIPGTTNEPPNASNSYEITRVSANSLFATLGMSNFTMTNQYNATFSADLNVKVTFNISAAEFSAGVRQSGNMFSDQHVHAANTFGAFVGTTAAKRLGVVFGHTKYPPTTSLAMGTAPTFGYSSFDWMYGVFGDFSTATTDITPTSPSGLVLANNSFSYSGFTATYNSSADSTPTAFTNTAVTGSTPLVVGSNTLLLRAQGSSYQVSLNGTAVFSGVSTAIISRTCAGLAVFGADILTAISQFGFPVYGITSFKAWPVGQVEPADQTGYGTYAGGYRDKYHSGGAYNPLA